MFGTFPAHGIIYKQFADACELRTSYTSCDDAGVAIYSGSSRLSKSEEDDDESLSCKRTK